MRRTMIGLALAASAIAQAPSAPALAIPPGSITAVISSQGTDAIKQVTGVAIKTASLARIDVCNGDPATDHTISSSRLVSAIIVKQKMSVYSSEVVQSVLAVLQQKDIYTRAQKIITSGGNTLVLLSALFKTVNPLTAAVINAAPSIASAVLPAVSDPRDLISLGSKILQDNSALALGRAGAGNDCHTGLIVAMTSSVEINVVVVQ